ncbi:MAG: carboxymuconolactone decarboxylase family protein [Nevskiaceae bacterium]|jgi:uncharacterized peroxidase-related enzyme|nr:MAG: carboxymuconolactone decarboxylase family protein [Nevskiaceae bacterium]
MQRIVTPNPEQVPTESKPTLDLFTKNLGFTPNMLAIFAQSPTAFNAWFSLRTALNRTLDMQTREAISLIVSEVNGCNYCLAVHTYVANLAKMPPDEIILARKGGSSDSKRDAAIKFARTVIEQRGQLTDSDFKAVKDAGFSDPNILEIISLVAMYSLTNFFNNVFDPDKDYPPVPPAGSL